MLFRTASQVVADGAPNSTTATSWSHQVWWQTGQADPARAGNPPDNGKPSKDHSFPAVLVSTCYAQKASARGYSKCYMLELHHRPPPAMAPMDERNAFADR
eukprot:scaffold91273_cov41-Prasinocladus_malaysianus.AAC.1